MAGPNVEPRSSEDHSLRVELTVSDEGRHAILLAGELDLHTASQFREALGEAIDDGVRRLVVDLSEVTFIDSTALGVLMGGVARLRLVDGSLDVVCPNEKIRRIFEVTGLDQVLAISAGPEEMLSRSG